MKKEKFKSVLGIIVIISIIAFLTVSCSDGPSGGGGASVTPPTSIFVGLTDSYPSDTVFTSVGLPARIDIDADELVDLFELLVEGDDTKGVDSNWIFENYVGYLNDYIPAKAPVGRIDYLLLYFETTEGNWVAGQRYFNGMVGWLVENLELSFHKWTEDGSSIAEASWNSVPVKKYYDTNSPTDLVEISKPADGNGKSYYYTETCDLFECRVSFNRADKVEYDETNHVYIKTPACTLEVLFAKEAGFTTDRIFVLNSFVPGP
jgi:hypothetical protein